MRPCTVVLCLQLSLLSTACGGHATLSLGSWDTQVHHHRVLQAQHPSAPAPRAPVARQWVGGEVSAGSPAGRGRGRSPNWSIDLDAFVLHYGQDDHGSEPKADPNHQDYDPFHVPMPKLKRGLDPVVAFHALDMDHDGRINRAEFQNLKSLLTLPKLHQLGMSKDTFVQWHGSDDHDHNKQTFANADHDDSGRLSRKEYDLFRSRNEL